MTKTSLESGAESYVMTQRDRWEALVRLQAIAFNSTVDKGTRQAASNAVVALTRCAKRVGPCDHTDGCGNSARRLLGVTGSIYRDTCFVCGSLFSWSQE